MDGRIQGALRILALGLAFVALPCFVAAQELHQSPHGNLNVACDVCHSPDSWKVALDHVTFDHSRTAFPLEGQHKTVSCRDCHTTLNFSAAATECASCHQDIHSGQFGDRCAVCHTPDGWQNQAQMSTRHTMTRFPLTGVHRGVDCQSCHAGGRYVGTPLNCADCHFAQADTTTNPNHRQAGFAADCALCHSVETAAWTGASFTHPASFPLTGGHAGRTCAACHASGYVNTSAACASCHIADFDRTTNPNHAAGNFSQQCSQCHTTTAWTPASFDHNLSRFPLTGRHLQVACAQCHVGGRFTGTPQDCYSCHQSNFQNVSDPNHVAGNYDHNCLICHTTAGWTPAIINHDLTRFPLLGAHRTVACAACHASGFNNAPTECFGCHQNDFQNVHDPNHVSGNYDHNCMTCHTMDGWKPATFDHTATRFPLTGAHRTLDCTQCHATGFDGTATDCYSCHRANFEQVQSPNHVHEQFSHDCTTCHTTSQWKPSTFDHSQTTFPLTGAHLTTDCVACHVNGQYQGLATDCYTCHRTNFEQVQTPNHVQGQFNHDCTICHNTTQWKPSTFDHNGTTFPLTGAHRTTDCVACHVNGQFANLPTGCWSCHQHDFAGTNNPNHVEKGFSQECTICHTTGGWSPAKVDHSRTSFPLTGAHKFVSCDKCHPTGRFTGTPTDCWACHQNAFEEVRDPSHEQGQFDHNCAICHRTTGWNPASFDHTRTNFPLTGVHITVSCAACHPNGRFANTPAVCYSCHQTNFENAAQPNHVQEQFSHDCATCHSTTAWQPSTFDHGTTNFPLAGAHRTVDCVLCHVNGQYPNLPTACYGCHQHDFEGVQDPNHVTGQFDHNCAICHSVDAWNPATFDHSQTHFPLTGAHVTAQCAACHVNGRFAGTPTDCWSCHQNDFNGANNPDHQQAQFDHNCAICHSTTGWQPSTFDHSQTRFPLTGAHQQVQCAQCHVNGRYAGTPMDCWSCHTNDYNGAANPNHANAQYPHDCTVCHTTTNWLSNFNHSTWYRLGEGHSGVACNVCHTDPNNFQVFTCIVCHEHSQASMDNRHADVQGYAYNSAACYNCHRNGGGGGIISPFQHNIKAR